MPRSVRTLLGPAAALAVCALLCVELQAAPLTLRLTFDVSDFVDQIDSAPPPIPGFSGTFRATFDPAVAHPTSAVGLSVESLTFPNLLDIGSVLSFSYSATFHTLAFGGSANNAGGVQAGTSDFTVQFDLANVASPAFVTCANPAFNCGNGSGSAALFASAYVVPGSPGSVWFARTAHLTSSLAVPEPGTLALLAIGLAGALGVARRHS